MESLVVLFAAPIPVGHRVDVRWYVVERGGLFGRSRDERAHEPVLTDLDTGVVYLSDFALDGPGVKHPRQPVGVDPARLPATPTRTLTGTVRSCRVVTVRAFSEIDLQTHLEIAPD